MYEAWGERAQRGGVARGSWGGWMREVGSVARGDAARHCGAMVSWKSKV
ncbi:hypothetical protein HMPREF1980_01734 [Actinomyces sp. oral taxon 172 str. F0311]|nr:hypothetical protein HMPREF1980_01734 [Actinomyces sp. oral taxon 172 str. F0311]